jgi:hypothetical protein
LLLGEQQRTWPMLRDGLASLLSVRTRELVCDGYQAWLQFNPGRIVSTGARVDAASIRARRCFLCVENLPPEQKGILFRDRFLILCNPAPIFTSHFTISSIRHEPQELCPDIDMFLVLAREMPGYTVFYNGPKCGASAPDHLHFQAAPAGAIPIEREAVKPERRKTQRAVSGVIVTLLHRLARQVVTLEGKNAADVKDVLTGFLDAFRARAGVDAEPMVNILCLHSPDGWRLIIFPRKKHRPDVYFKEEALRVTVSPAAVDMGGLIITPIERDFLSISPELVDAIYREVSLDGDEVEAIVRTL